MSRGLMLSALPILVVPSIYRPESEEPDVSYMFFKTSLRLDSFRRRIGDGHFYSV
jgi:hypothetical protein